MNILEVIYFCQHSDDITIPQIQVKFGITYKIAKSFVDKLITEGELAYASGIKYNYIGNFGDLHEIEFDESKEAARWFEDRRRYLDVRRRQFESRIRKCINNDDEDDEEEIEEDELCYKALKVCIEKNSASTSLIQRTFPIGYLRACKLIDWMEEKGYVSPSFDSEPRKVLITIEEFNKIFSDTN